MDAAAGRTALGLGTAATTAATTYDAAGAATAAQAASQPLDNDLTAIATLTTTAYGRAPLTQVDAAARRTNLGLGTAATVNTGVASGEVPLLSTRGRLLIARVASGTPTGLLFVRDDGVLAAPGEAATTTSQSMDGSIIPLKAGRASGQITTLGVPRELLDISAWRRQRHDSFFAQTHSDAAGLQYYNGGCVRGSPTVCRLQVDRRSARDCAG